MGAALQAGQQWWPVGRGQLVLLQLHIGQDGADGGANIVGDKAHGLLTLGLQVTQLVQRLLNGRNMLAHKVPLGACRCGRR